MEQKLVDEFASNAGALEACEFRLKKFGCKTTDLSRNVDNGEGFVAKEVRNTRGEVFAVLLQVHGNSVVIDYPANSTTSHLNFLKNLRKLNVEIVDGSLHVEIDGVRKFCRAVGVFEDLEIASGKIVLPKKFKIPSVETMSSKDDSFGKARWREELKQFFLDCYPRGLFHFPEEARKVVMFPGLGKEAELWAEVGFDVKDMFFIEHDPDIANGVMKNFPEANLFSKNVENNLSAFDRFLGDNQFALVSLDPESQMSRKFSRVLLQLKKRDRAVGMLAYNFYARRERPTTQDFYRSVNDHIISYHTKEKLELARDDLPRQRKAASENFLNYSWCEGECGEYYTAKVYSELCHSGHYEASGGGDMIYALHKIVR